MHVRQCWLCVHTRDASALTAFMVMCWEGQFKHTRPTAANAVTSDVDTTTDADLAVCNELCSACCVDCVDCASAQPRCQRIVCAQDAVMALTVQTNHSNSCHHNVQHTQWQPGQKAL